MVRRSEELRRCGSRVFYITIAGIGKVSKARQPPTVWRFSDFQTNGLGENERNRSARGAGLTRRTLSDHMIVPSATRLFNRNRPVNTPT
jgi:hypothetical protein